MPAMVPGAVIGRVDAIPVKLSSGISFGTSVDVSVLGARRVDVPVGIVNANVCAKPPLLLTVSLSAMGAPQGCALLMATVIGVFVPVVCGLISPYEPAPCAMV